MDAPCETMAKQKQPLSGSSASRVILALLVSVVAAAAIWRAGDFRIAEAPTAPSQHARPAAADGRRPAPAAGPQTPSFDIVRVSPQGTGVMAGRAAPGAEVIVRNGRQEIGRTRADANGDWVLIPSAPLPPGAEQLTLAERTRTGQEVAGQRSVVLVIPQRPAAARTEAGAKPAQQPMALLTEGSRPPRVLQGPASARRAAASRPGHGRLRRVRQGAVRRNRGSRAAPCGSMWTSTRSATPQRTPAADGPCCRARRSRLASMSPARSALPDRERSRPESNCPSPGPVSRRATSRRAASSCSRGRTYG